MKEKTLRVAIVGCGQIADAHLQELRYVPTAEVVAVCDQYPELADQAARRFSVPESFSDLDELLDRARPDVVHLTTPPHTHAALACRLLEAGVHVYVEKPFTVDLAETDRVLQAAESSGKLVTVGHDHLFDPVWQRLERHVAAGDLGEIVHIDSVMGYNLDGPFGKLMFSDARHWLHRLPGGLFHNNISHALYKITPFLLDEHPKIFATTDGTSARTPSTELRVLIQGAEATANVLFSSRARPVARTAKLYGTKATVEIDMEARTLRWHRGGRLPGALAKVDLPWQHVREAMRNLRQNTWDFLRFRQQYFAGMRELFRRFYASILAGQQPPIAYGQIRRVTAWMDDIFEQCDQDRCVAKPELVC
jgi:predicted dehydrogenase